MNRRSPSSVAKGDEGFTLVEMLVVLAMIALVASLGIPHLAHRAGDSLERTADRLAEALRRERTLAIAQAQRRQVDVDVGKASIAFLSGEVIQIQRSIAMRIVTGDKTVVAPDRAALVFLPDGSASGLSIELSDKSQIRRIEVHWLTGLVRETARDAM